MFQFHELSKRTAERSHFILLFTRMIDAAMTISETYNMCMRWLDDGRRRGNFTEVIVKQNADIVRLFSHSARVRKTRITCRKSIFIHAMIHVDSYFVPAQW